MQKREFHSIDQLEDVKSQLATAERKPVLLGDRVYEEWDHGEPEYREVTEERAIELRGRSGLWNERDNQLEYISSDSYELIQHEEALELVQDAVAQTVGEIDMGVIRDYGSQIDGTLVFSNLEEASINVEDVVDTDGYIPPEGDVDPFGGARARDTVGLGARLWNSFDGERKIGGSVMAYRFICQNWMVWGEETIREIEHPHSVGALDPEEDTDEDIQNFFEELIHVIFEFKENYETIIRESENEEIPFEWIPGLLEQAGFGSTYQKRITGRALRQRTPRSGYTTSWRLYNAATDYLDNDRAGEILKHSYDDHQESAWKLLGEPSEPEETKSVNELEEWAIID